VQKLAFSVRPRGEKMFSAACTLSKRVTDRSNRGQPNTERVQSV
jgi:hypothetical protein